MFFYPFFPLMFILDADLCSSNNLLATENPLMVNHKSMTSFNKGKDVTSSAGILHLGHAMFEAVVLLFVQPWINSLHA